MHVKRQTILPASEEVVWELLLRGDTLAKVAQGVVTYGSLPEKWERGERYNILPSVCGGPSTDHFVTFVEINEQKGIMTTEESGGLIISWQHQMSITGHGRESSILTDVVTINAGWATVAVWLFSEYFYWHRHRQWKKLLASLPPE